MEQRIRQYLFDELETGGINHRISVIDKIAIVFSADVPEVEDLMERIETFLTEAFPQYVEDHKDDTVDDLIVHFWKSIGWIFSLKNLSYTDFVVQCQDSSSVIHWVRIIRRAAKIPINEFKPASVVKKLL